MVVYLMLVNTIDRLTLNTIPVTDLHKIHLVENEQIPILEFIGMTRPDL
jgi:hypothetical protein